MDLNNFMMARVLESTSPQLSPTMWKSRFKIKSRSEDGKKNTSFWNKKQV